ncbi:MAG TPA: GNAT family N-acetyltransferase [Acidimicrobiales bacterium]|nr:GNAT family N-acetyltransferase [Acidimicrobiales bacterium]
MSVVVRGVERHEVSAAVRVIEAGSLHPGAESPDDVVPYWAAVEETRAAGGDVLVAVDAGEVVGVAQVVVFAHLQRTGGRCAEVESVHVRADRRGEGIGAALLARAEALARERGCYRIQLTSNVVRTDAHRFYGRLGYEPTHVGFKKYLVDLA